jgi:hypothetical protein
MKKDVQKRLLIVGGVIGLGVVAYVLYNRSQEGDGAPSLPTGGGGGTLPKTTTTTTTTKPAPTPSQIQAYKDAVTRLDNFMVYVRSNPPQSEIELATVQAKAEQLKQAVRAAAAVIGVTPNV